jgi:hypothetical protein
MNNMCQNICEPALNTLYFTEVRYRTYQYMSIVDEKTT